VPHFVIEVCIRCGACPEVCPVECIVPGPGDGPWPVYYIDPDTCIDCGACVPECPVDAIYIEEDEVPVEYDAWPAANEAFFSEGPGYDALDDAGVAPWWD
jgi:ferredoxin